MAHPRTVIARWSDGGQFLELRQRGVELQIVDDDGVLRSSQSRRRSEALARLTLAQVSASAPRVLVVGLGLGFSVRGALDALPAAATIAVCETNRTIIDWCGHSAVAEANGSALADPRVNIVEEDGAAVIARSQAGLFDAILVDLPWGPSTGYAHLERAYFGEGVLERVHGALWRGGALGVWSETLAPAFEKRLAAARFSIDVHDVGEGGSKAVGYVARYR